MTEGNAPKSWIGREVMVGVGRGANIQRLTGVLKEVNDMGIVMYYPDVPETPPQYVFYPWRFVQAIQISEEDRQERKTYSPTGERFVAPSDNPVAESDSPSF